MGEKTDEEIASLVEAGDVESFGFLMERYEKKLTRYAKKFLRNNDDITDLVQEVFIKSYVNIRSFDKSRKFSPWIYRIAHNTFVNAVRKKWREPFSFDLDVLLPHPAAKETADEETHKEDLRLMLDKCLDKLDPKYREPLILYYFEEMDYKEIAEIMEIPNSTVGVRLSRGKAELKKLIKEIDASYG